MYRKAHTSSEIRLSSERISRYPNIAYDQCIFLHYPKVFLLNESDWSEPNSNNVLCFRNHCTDILNPFEMCWHSSLQWRHNGRNSVSNHQPHDCLLNRLFRRRSKKTSKLRLTGLCAGNSPVTGEFPTQMASNAEKVSIWWRHYDSACICMYQSSMSNVMFSPTRN